MHLCHVRNCKTPVHPRKLMCLHHWRLCPSDLRRAVRREYRPGQETDKNPSQIYLAVAQLALDAVRLRETGAVF